MITNSFPKNNPPRKKSGYQPSNCGEPVEESPEIQSSRDAYRIVAAYISNDPSKNCCTIGADNRVKMWKATELPVILEKADKSITFFCSEWMDVIE